MPERIQRKRAKGWKMPPDTVCVDRTTKWGPDQECHADVLLGIANA